MKYLQNAWTRKSGSGLGRKYIDMNGGGRLLHSTYCKKKKNKFSKMITVAIRE